MSIDAPARRGGVGGGVEGGAERPTEPPDGATEEPAGPFAGTAGRWFLAALVVVVACGAVLRFLTKSDLWLDEALTASISRRPVGDLLQLLRHEPAPPLYYLLLHLWMRVLGTSDLAIRSLSGIFGLVVIGLTWLAGLRAGGRSPRREWVAAGAVAIVAASPYAIRYSTENRMYTLEMAFVLLGYLAVARAIERPTLGRLAAVTVLTAALLYTQYWAFYLVLVTAALVAWRIRRSAERSTAMRVLLALGVGCLLFVPWIPTFVYQATRDGTPWAHSTVPPSGVRFTLTDFAGGAHVEADPVLLLLVVLSLLALFGVARGPRRIELDLRTQPGVRAEWFVWSGTLAVGLGASYVAGVVFQTRYAAIVFPLFVLTVAFGITVFGSRVARYLLLAVLVALGVIGGARNVTEKRTQAGEVAAAVNAEARPGDVLAYCPDQIGPAASRLVRSDVRQGSFPGFREADLVDWVDYVARNERADPAAFAADLVRRAGPDHAVWFASSPGYVGVEGKCEAVSAALAGLRPRSGVVVTQDASRFFESEGLVRYLP